MKTSEKENGNRPWFEYDYPEFVTVLERTNRKTGEVTKNPYMTVEGRLAGFVDYHHKKGLSYQITSEFVGENPTLCNITVFSEEKGMVNAHAAAYGQSVVDKSNPFENAETSALGRALAMMGFGLIGSGGLASADEVKEAISRQESDSPKSQPSDATTGNPEAYKMNTDEKKHAIANMLKAMFGDDIEDAAEYLDDMTAWVKNAGQPDEKFYTGKRKVGDLSDKQVEKVVYPRVKNAYDRYRDEGGVRPWPIVI